MMVEVVKENVMKNNIANTSSRGMSGAGKWISGLAATALAMATAGGCSSQPIAHAEDFNPPGATTPVGQFAQAQAAAGAHADGMLYAQHFNAAGQLNSLGQVKLDLLLKGTPVSDAVTVYLDLPKSTNPATLTACQTAVTTYLQTAGVPQAQIEVVMGPNPTNTATAAANLPTFYKPAGDTFNGQGGDALSSGDLNGVSAASAGGTH